MSSITTEVVGKHFRGPPIGGYRATMTTSGPKASTGKILLWDGRERAGVIESAATPGGCWFHGLDWQGEDDPQVGHVVWFRYQPLPQQAGYRYRASVVGTFLAE